MPMTKAEKERLRIEIEAEFERACLAHDIAEAAHDNRILAAAEAYEKAKVDARTARDKAYDASIAEAKAEFDIADAIYIKAERKLDRELTALDKDDQ
jgi:hypothetical protein